jgi:spermidine synthase
VAVVGLGIGTMATYVRPDQHWTFYEIDPAVERIARNSTYFTYMKNCGDQCGVVLGDARLSLARPDTPMFGLIVLDAFSSDSIPIHLMTSEAFSLYLRRLSPGGAIAFHISNRHLTLAPILARLAAEHGLVAIEQKDWVGSTVLENGKTSSDWVVLARDRASFGPLASDSRWITPAARSTTPLWTDDFSNILGAVTILN